MGLGLGARTLHLPASSSREGKEEEFRAISAAGPPSRRYNQKMVEHLWAPWRMRYLEGGGVYSGDEAKCLFEALVEAGDDEKALVLKRGEYCYAVLNAYPYSNGHLMVAPYQHTAEILDLSDGALLEINKMLGEAVSWLRKAYNPQGFNIGVNLGAAGGAGVPDHIHWHVVPRWNGDTNFMTVTANTRVIPEELTDAYNRIRAVIEK